MSKKNINLWPYGIVVSIFIFIGLCVWTIQKAFSISLHDELIYFQKYQDVDENINELIISQAKFDQKYKILIDKKGFKKGQNNIKISIIDKDSGEKMDNVKLQVLITRPLTSKYDLLLKPQLNDNKEFEFNSFNIDKLGRWQIAIKATIGKLSTFKKYDINAST